VGEFLRSCAQALQAEASERRLSLVAALENELRNIGWHIDTTEATASQRGTLVLTENFYRGVRSQSPVDDRGFWEAVDASIGNIQREILAIKVTEEAP
jgi:hypothetical protein